MSTAVSIDSGNNDLKMKTCTYSKILCAGLPEPIYVKETKEEIMALAGYVCRNTTSSYDEMFKKNQYLMSAVAHMLTWFGERRDMAFNALGTSEEEFLNILALRWIR